MPIITRATQHRKTTVYLTREQDSIPIERNKGILQLVKSNKIIGVGHTDSRTMIAITPGHIVAVFDKANPWVISIDPGSNLSVITLKL